MPQNRIDDFKHLFRALEAGCPPHAGLAIGFDRLIAVMLGRDTVRDVIAFPKTSNGEDPMVESPGPLHRKQLKAYHLRVVQPERLEPLREEQHHAKHSRTEAVEQPNPPQDSAAVMVGDFDAMKTYLTDVVSPSLKSVLLNPNMVANGQVELHELSGLVGETTLDMLKLEGKVTAEEKRGKTVWGQQPESKREVKRKERPIDSGTLEG
jgi:hypothetical protein